MAAANAAAAEEITPPLPGQPPVVSPPTLEELPSFRNFHTEVIHTLTCSTCHHSWTRMEPLRDLSLDLAPATSNATTIEDLLHPFFADDELEVSPSF